MKFVKTQLKDAYLIELDVFKDKRGTFARQFCKEELKKHGINFNICQCNISQNYKKNTIRGLHYQKDPFLEPKIVSCFQGKIYDVIVDLRKKSPTYLQWQSFELSSKNNKILYIPPNFAHGFQTLQDNTVIFYQLGEFFNSKYYSGIRYDDPKIGIKWKKLKTKPIINERDKNYEFI